LEEIPVYAKFTNQRMRSLRYFAGAKDYNSKLA
jgi:hypothetical protein